MASLPLDDARWVQLWTNNGPARNLPELITYLLEHPDNVEAFTALNEAICADGATLSGGFAAMPYLVEMARKLPASQRATVLNSIGWIVVAADPSSEDAHFRLEPYLAESYHQSIQDSLALLTETLLAEQSDADMLSLLFAAAALKGHVGLAGVLGNLDSCEHCSQLLQFNQEDPD
jgi:cell wall assembly regulator SMI1